MQLIVHFISTECKYTDVYKLYNYTYPHFSFYYYLILKWFYGEMHEEYEYCTALVVVVGNNRGKNYSETYIKRFL